MLVFVNVDLVALKHTRTNQKKKKKRGSFLKGISNYLIVLN